VAADLRERVARAIARDENGDETGWQAWRNEADAVLAELKQELQPQAGPMRECAVVFTGHGSVSIGGGGSGGVKASTAPQGSEAALAGVVEALEDCIDSLEYVNRTHPEASGWGVRSERIAKARAALAAVRAIYIVCEKRPTKMFRYKLFVRRDHTDAYVIGFYSENSIAKPTNQPGFVKWIDEDWQTVEVEVP
jgi:hypothetical protein